MMVMVMVCSFVMGIRKVAPDLVKPYRKTKKKHFFSLSFLPAKYSRLTHICASFVPRAKSVGVSWSEEQTVE